MAAGRTYRFPILPVPPVADAVLEGMLGFSQGITRILLACIGVHWSMLSTLKYLRAICVLQTLEELGGEDMFDPLAAYTQRHFARVDRLLDGSCVLDYVMGAMNFIQPSAGLEGVEGTV